MNEHLKLLIIVLFFGSFITIALSMNKQSKVFKHIRKHHPSEWERLGWSDEASQEEGFLEEQVIPYVQKGEYLRLNDSALSKLSENMKRSKLHSYSSFFVVALILVILIAFSFGALNA